MDPDPQPDPDQAECKRCHDTGEVPGTYNICPCTGMSGPRWQGPV